MITNNMQKPARQLYMLIKKCFFIFSVSILAYIPVSAQSLSGKSQILIAYESKAAFLGEVVFIGEKPNGFYTSISTSQTAVFKVKKQLRGKIEATFVAVGIAVTGDLHGAIFEKSDYIVFLSDYSGNGNSDSCGHYALDAKNTKFKVQSDSKRAFKMPCYHVDELNNIVEGTKEEIEAIKGYLNFLENRK